MKYASVYSRKGRTVWYISYLDSKSGKRIHRATKFGVENPGSKRKAYDQAMGLSKASQAAFPDGPAAGWESWVPDFFQLHYGHSPKTHLRYSTSWSHVFEFLQDSALGSPAAIEYQHADLYLRWRTAQRRHRGTLINYNTALHEVKVFSLIMKEAVRRSLAPGNPIAQLSLKKHKPKEKPEIRPNEEAIIREALKTEPEWMQDSFAVAMAQGCRLSETAVPLSDGRGGQQCLNFAVQLLRHFQSRRISIRSEKTNHPVVG